MACDVKVRRPEEIILMLFILLFVRNLLYILCVLYFCSSHGLDLEINPISNFKNVLLSLPIREGVIVRT